MMNPVYTKKKIKNTGQDTTASALTWMIKYLGENQKVLDILIVSSIISFSCGIF